MVIPTHKPPDCTDIIRIFHYQWAEKKGTSTPETSQIFSNFSHRNQSIDTKIAPTSGCGSRSAARAWPSPAPWRWGRTRCPGPRPWSSTSETSLPGRDPKNDDVTAESGDVTMIWLGKMMEHGDFTMIFLRKMMENCDLKMISPFEKGDLMI